jgi:hypothetical protein
MWAITNHTPYKAESIWGRDKDGVHEWIVAVKGTFDIKADGKVVLADEQLDPLLAPEYNGETGVSSLRYDRCAGQWYGLCPPRTSKQGLLGITSRGSNREGDSRDRQSPVEAWVGWPHPLSDRTYHVTADYLRACLWWVRPHGS